MNNHLFSILILLSISTHIFAMDETTPALFKEDADMDWSEWITEYQTPIIAGSVVGLGVTVSLYKWDKRPAVVSSAIAGGYLVYKWLEDQENDERSQRINALKAQYGIINSSIGEITDDLTQIKSDVINIRKNLERPVITLESIQKDLEESADEMKLAADSFKRTAVLLANSIQASDRINDDITTLKKDQEKLATLISRSHKTVKDSDTVNTDIILKAIAASSIGTHSSSPAAGQ